MNCPRFFQLACRPYSVIDAINRVAAAQGSCRYAALSANADYNGHFVTVSFNDFRGYWVAEYTWSGRVVLRRGSLRDCLEAAKAEYDRGAKGSQVMVSLRQDQSSWTDASLCIDLGFVPCSDDRPAIYGEPAWYTDLHREVNAAFMLERQVGIPAVGFLANATSMADYRAKIEAFKAERMQRRAGAA